MGPAPRNNRKSKKHSRKSRRLRPGWATSTELFLLVILVSKIASVVHQISS